MKKINLLLILLLNCFTILASSLNDEQLKEIGEEFRKCHPYGYQTVGLKHVGDDCVFVISEPSNRVSEFNLQKLFAKYQGRVISQVTKLGYDGWLKDVIGTIQFKDDNAKNDFKIELFSLLYGTAYKAEYTDLDQPIYHTYYSPYKLNFSISAAELSKWIIDDKELFVDTNGEVSTIQNALKLRVGDAGTFLKNNEFVAWIIKPNDFKPNSPEFLINARRFSLDSDLILGAFGNVGENVAIIARKRIVPVEILPPLRIETIELLCDTRNKNLAQSYERFHVFAGKTKYNEDVAPIYLSDELWNTEYGNLLNITDQMLKSWSENGRIVYRDFEYPNPIDWAFNRGAVSDFEADELTYNWNTAGSGYVLQGDAGFDIFAVNRTGSLPVSYIPGGMEGKVDERINDAEELAYDFFSGLNNPELARVVQYTTLYQIVQYFYKDPASEIMNLKFRYDDPFSFSSPSLFFSDIDILEKYLKVSAKSKTRPDYTYFETFVEKLLRIADSLDSQESQQIINEGFDRFYKRNAENDLKQKLSDLIEKDPYGEFADFLSQKYGKTYVDSVLCTIQDVEAVKTEYNEYLSTNIKTVKEYIDNYKNNFGSFPFEKAAHYAVYPREISQEINNLYAEYEQKQEHLSNRIDNYNSEVRRYNKNEAKKSILVSSDFSSKSAMEGELAGINQEEANLKKFEAQVGERVKLLTELSLDNNVQQSLGSLNWLLTDCRDYNEPFGEFFTEHFRDAGSVWLKSPTIACSTNGSGYGGHNLDSHVTPVKFADKIPSGKCKVSNVGGKHIIAVAKENWNRITPAVLRSIERKNLSGLVNLPKAPIIRSKSVLSSDLNDPHFDNNGNTIVPLVAKEKGVSLDGNHYDTVDELRQSFNYNSSINKIRQKEYSELEVLVSINDGPEHVLKRSTTEKFTLSKYDETRIEVVDLGNGEVEVTLPQREETINKAICTEASFGIEIPQKYSDIVVKAIGRLFQKSKDTINNLFKFKRALNLEIGDDMPPLELKLIQNEINNIHESLIIKENGTFFMDAA